MKSSRLAVGDSGGWESQGGYIDRIPDTGSLSTISFAGIEDAEIYDGSSQAHGEKMIDSTRPTEYLQHIARHARSSPGKYAVVNSRGEKIRYRDFISIYEQMEEFLVSSSVTIDDRVALIMRNEILACCMLLPIMDHAVLATIDYSLKEQELMNMFRLLRIDYVITDDTAHECIGAAEKLGLGIIFVTMDDNAQGAVCSPAVVKARVEYSGPDTKKSGKDTAFVATTSGTTSTPKIVPTTYPELTAANKIRTDTYRYTTDDVIYATARGNLTLIVIRDILSILSSGGTAVVEKFFDHGTFVGLLFRFGITIARLSPAVIASFCDFAEKNGIKVGGSGIKYILVGGASLPADLKKRAEDLLSTPLVHAYGMSEAKDIASTYNVTMGYKEGSAGVSCGLDVKVHDGEILVKGATVFRGYENPEIDNNEYFTDGWFHTGDMGYIDEDGYIFITGRIKEMINKGGEKISPYEVEKKILGHPRIKEAIVFPYPNEYGSEDAGAIIVRNDMEPMKLSELRNFLVGKVKPYKMPTLLFVADEIPRSANEKIQRNLLYGRLLELYPDQIQGNDSRHRGGKLNKTGSQVLKIWKSALKKGGLDINMTFTDLGGDSLNGVAVLSDIERKFKIRIPVDILFEGGTIKTVSDFIDRSLEKKYDYDFLVPIKAGGDKIPLICAHSGTGDEVTYRHIGKYMEKDRPVYALKFDIRKVAGSVPLSFDDISRKYADEIKRLVPEGPYHICGHCWGGVLAYKIASILRSDGCRVGMLAMFDSVDKERGNESGKRHESLARRFAISFKDSMGQLRGLSFTEKFRLVIRKTGSIISLVKLVQNKKLYAYGARTNNGLIMRITGRTGALGYAYRNYVPKDYEGELYYFKAVKGRSAQLKSEDYWSSRAGSFESIEMDFHHNDLVTGEGAKVLAGKLVSIMRRYDA
ncbi:MAG: AMP-binding protein [Clostridia bacterium]